MPQHATPPNPATPPTPESPPQPKAWDEPGTIPCVICGKAWAIKKMPGRENIALHTHCQPCWDEFVKQPPYTCHAHLEEVVQSRTKALFEGLIAALDYRDAETQWHSRRVSTYARHLALKLGVGGSELDIIQHGALFHDIGKIGIRDRILLKPGPLSDVEREEMKKHPQLGWELLQKIDFLKPASQVVLEHQEMWNGNGYPQGLKGEQISFGARVFSTVDTMDAMISDRPYRRATTMEAVRREMIRCSGKQFDPMVVEEFLKVSDIEWERLRQDVETVSVLNAEHAQLVVGSCVSEHDPRGA
jgi:putative nucleotidyltransferase with HDIG domain